MSDTDVLAAGSAHHADFGEHLEPMRPPGDTTGLFGVFRRRYLLKLLVRKEVRVRYSGSLLGIFWSYAKPLMRFFTYFVVLGYILNMHRAVPNYAFHIFSGLVVVTFFTESLGAGTTSVVKNKSLVRKMNLPREMFPVASLLVTIWHSGPQYIILAVGCAIVGWHPDAYGILCGLIGFAVVAVFSLAVSLSFSALNVFFRDFQNFVVTINQMIMWSTPMIYTYEQVQNTTHGSWFPTVYLANPLADAVLLVQRCFWLATIPVKDRRGLMPTHILERGLIMLAIGLVLVAVAQLLFSRLESRFAEQL
ncbi:MAG: ABC transporter permease [Nocardioidaceae bacterium]